MKKLVFFSMTLLSIMSCSKSEIKTGDLVFVDDTSSNLTKAINDVTQSSGQKNYTHVGVCQLIANEVYVYHASTTKNVVKEKLSVFKADRKQAHIDVYRISKLNDAQKEMAIAKAETYLGKTYDFAYLMDEEGVYCSELIYRIFEKDSIFKLNPMTFVDPKTGQFHVNWITHYCKLNMRIPEGELGCNPNDMAKNSRLTFLKSI